MQQKSKILTLIILNTTFLFFISIALFCSSGADQLPGTAGPQTTVLGDSSERAPLSKLMSSIHSEFQPPISRGKSKTGEEILKIRIGGPMFKLSCAQKAPK